MLISPSVKGLSTVISSAIFLLLILSATQTLTLVRVVDMLPLKEKSETTETMRSAAAKLDQLTQKLWINMKGFLNDIFEEDKIQPVFDGMDKIMEHNTKIIEKSHELQTQ